MAVVDHLGLTHQQMAEPVAQVLLPVAVAVLDHQQAEQQAERVAQVYSVRVARDSLVLLTKARAVAVREFLQ